MATSSSRLAAALAVFSIPGSAAAIILPPALPPSGTVDLVLDVNGYSQ